MPTPSIDQLKSALKISEQIRKLEQQLAELLGTPAATRTYTKKSGPDSSAPAKKKRKKPVISPEGKARIAAAQRARWAKQKKEKKAS